MDEREQRVQAIEGRAREFRRTGETQKWLAEGDPKAQVAAARVNGPLMLLLAQDTKFTDCECVNTLRHGAAAMKLVRQCGPQLAELNIRSALE